MSSISAVLSELIFISCFILNIVQLPPPAKTICSYSFGTCMSKDISVSRKCATLESLGMILYLVLDALPFPFIEMCQ